MSTTNANSAPPKTGGAKRCWWAVKAFFTGKAREDWESKTQERLTDEKLLDCERDIAYAAWLHALSERRSKQLGILSIPAAAGALTAAFVSSDKDGSLLSIIGIIAGSLLAAIVALQLLFGRDIEAMRAAAAVHEHRASRTCSKPADTSSGNGPSVAPNQGHSQGESKKEQEGAPPPPPPVS